MSQIIIAGMFKQKLCMGQRCSCSTFLLLERAITGAKRKMRSFAWLVADSLQEVLVAAPVRQDKGLVSSTDTKPLKNDTANFAKYFRWCSNSSGGENVRRKNPRWACERLAELCGTDMRELSASPGLDGVVKLPVSAARTCSPSLAACSLACSRLSLPSTKKSNTLLWPQDVLSGGDKVLFRLFSTVRCETAQICH